jgi:hypothetical protein
VPRNGTRPGVTEKGRAALTHARCPAFFITRETALLDGIASDGADTVGKLALFLVRKSAKLSNPLHVTALAFPLIEVVRQERYYGFLHVSPDRVITWSSGESRPRVHAAGLPVAAEGRSDAVRAPVQPCLGTVGHVSTSPDASVSSCVSRGRR